MRKLTIGLLTVAGVALAMPAYADGVYVGAGPVGVGVLKPVTVMNGDITTLKTAMRWLLGNTAVTVAQR